MKLKVEGMSCNHCKMSVEEAVKKINGVKDAEVDLENKELNIKGEDLDIKLIEETIDALGFDLVDRG